MTLRDLVEAAKREEEEAYYTLRQVSDLTGTPLKTVRGWREDGSLEVVFWGPHRRLRVSRTVILRMFCQHREAESRPRPGVRYAGNGYRPCNPSAAA